MQEQPLSRRQVELILRRTAEIEGREQNERDLITTADLERVAADLNLPVEALRQAIAESRAGVLAEPGERDVWDKVFGERFVEARRFVPGPLGSARAAVETFLENQGFQKRRHQGEVSHWEAASDMKAHMRRAFRAGPYRLPRGIELEVRVTELAGGPHPILVHVRVDATGPRRGLIGGAAFTTVLGAGAAVAGAVLLPLPLELAAGAGGAVAAVGTLGARSAHKGSMAKTQVALDRFLDFLEHEPQSVQAPTPGKDLMAKVMSFLSDEWWK